MAVSSDRLVILRRRILTLERLMLDMSLVPTWLLAVVALSAHLVFCHVLYRNLPTSSRFGVVSFAVLGPLCLAFLTFARNEGLTHVLMLWLIGAVSGAIGCAGQRRRFAVGASSTGRLQSTEQINAAWAIMGRVMVPMVLLVAAAYIFLADW